MHIDEVYSGLVINQATGQSGCERSWLLSWQPVDGGDIIRDGDDDCDDDGGGGDDGGDDDCDDVDGGDDDGGDGDCDGDCDGERFNLKFLPAC